MGQIQPPSLAILLIAISSRYREAIEWSGTRASHQFGPAVLISDAFAFTETDYYDATMGTDLLKQFVAFQQPIDPGTLADVKLQTNAWEAEYAALGLYPEPRPLNLDPGYITPAKLVLASTKDHAHRIYLRGGIYAEVTLVYRDRRWQALEWTYPDYRREDYHRFFSECRGLLTSSKQQQQQQQ